MVCFTVSEKCLFYAVSGLVWCTTDRSVFILSVIFSAALKYTIIGGQHITEALKARRAELFSEGRDVSEVYSSVIATVLKHETPLPIRLYAAGDSQAHQASFEPLALQDVGRLFLPGGQLAEGFIQ